MASPVFDLKSTNDTTPLHGHLGPARSSNKQTRTRAEYEMVTRLAERLKPDMENIMIRVVQHPRRGQASTNPDKPPRGRTYREHKWPSAEPKPILELKNSDGKPLSILNVNNQVMVYARLTECCDDGREIDASERLSGQLVANPVQVRVEGKAEVGYIPFPFLYIATPGRYYFTFFCFEMTVDSDTGFDGLVFRCKARSDAFQVAPYKQKLPAAEPRTALDQSLDLGSKSKDRRPAKPRQSKKPDICNTLASVAAEHGPAKRQKRHHSSLSNDAFLPAPVVLPPGPYFPAGTYIQNIPTFSPAPFGLGPFSFTATPQYPNVPATSDVTYMHPNTTQEASDAAAAAAAAAVFAARPSALLLPPPPPPPPPPQPTPYYHHVVDGPAGSSALQTRPPVYHLEPIAPLQPHANVDAANGAFGGMDAAWWLETDL